MVVHIVVDWAIELQTVQNWKLFKRKKLLISGRRTTLHPLRQTGSNITTVINSTVLYQITVISHIYMYCMYFKIDYAVNE